MNNSSSITSLLEFLKKKNIVVMFSSILAALLISGYFLGIAFGASEEVLYGDGSMDSSLQVDSWTLTNKTGTSTWDLDSDTYFRGTGSGKLASSAGDGISVDSFVYYRFTTAKVPISATLDLAYKKQFISAQPAEGDWNVSAEVWEVGGSAPLQTMDIDNGSVNVDFKELTGQILDSVVKPHTQYEIRLIQQGRTANDAAAQLITWFDEVKVNVEYDSTQPQVVSATVYTDDSVDVLFNELVDGASAEDINNYSISPSLNVSKAVLQPDGKTVRLNVETQTKGSDYTLTITNVQDISLNTMSSSDTAVFTGIDTTPPDVISGTAVKDNKVDVKFTEQIDKASAEDVGNYSISPTLQITDAILQPDGVTVQLTTSTQTSGADYLAVVMNIKDSSGNLMTGSRTISFTGVDTTPPKPISATAVDDTTVRVVFDERVDKVTASEKVNYEITASLSVTGASLLADEKTVELKTSAQVWQTNYTVTATNIKDTSGNVISTVNQVTFSGEDSTVPRVVSASPVNDRTVDIIFSEALDAATSQVAENFSITPNLLIENAVLQGDGKTVRLTTAPQGYRASYFVTVNGVKDLAGNQIASDNTCTFIGGDSTPPKVITVVSTSYNTVDVSFSEKLDSVTAQTPANFAINPDLSVKTAVLQPDGTTVRLTTGPQAGGAIYSLTVLGIEDLAGNKVQSAIANEFAGVSPPVLTAPKVLSATTPDNTTVAVTFGTTMDAVSAQNPANYSISPALPVTGAILQRDGVTVRLSTATQTSGTIYTVTVVNVQDQYGNKVGDTDNSATFTGSGLVTTNPHGRYLSDTNQCSNCHATHDGKGQGLINQQDQKELCYLCHDAGGQSQFDVADQFGTDAPYAVSHHKVPEGTMQCSDCHNPHDGGKDINGNEIHWTRLLSSSADPSSHGGNQFCLSCHQTTQGDTKAINSATYPADGVGHNNSSFIINGTTPFNPESGSDIRCAGCHEQHGSTQEKLLKDKIGDNDQTPSGNNNSLCFKCHADASQDNRFSGQSVYTNELKNPHSLSTSGKTNASFPGVNGRAGQCANCHDPHGSSYGTSGVSMKTLRAPYNDGKTSYSGADFTLCFSCHNNTSADNKYDIQTPYNASQGGHYIKSSGGNLVPGSKMPCEACHTLHGSDTNNKYMLKDSLGSGLGDGRNECLACHNTGKVVEGITMSPPSASVAEHNSEATPCLNCHGSAHDTSLK